MRSVSAWSGVTSEVADVEGEFSESVRGVKVGVL